MKIIVSTFLTSLFLLSCGTSSNSSNPNSSSTTPNTSTSTPKPKPIETNQSPTPTGSNTYITYTKHPQASALLSENQLSAKKQFTKLGDALKEPQNVYRLKVGDYESGFDAMKLSEKIGDLYNLQELEIDGVYESLPKEIGKLTQLQRLTIYTRNLKSELPNEIANLKNIKFLYLINGTISENIKCTLSFSTLNLIPKVGLLRIEGKGFKELPCSLFKISMDEIHLTDLAATTIPDCISASNFKKATFSLSPQITKLPKLPASLKNIDIYAMHGLSDLSLFSANTASLEVFDLRDCKNLTVLSDFSPHSKVNLISILGLPKLAKLCSFDKLQHLNTLNLSGLPLVEGQLIGQQNQLYRLQYINLSDLPKPITLPDLANSFFFKILNVSNSVPNFKSAANFFYMDLESAKKRNEKQYTTNESLQKTRQDRAFAYSQDLYFEFYKIVNINNALLTQKKGNIEGIQFTLDAKSNESYPKLLNQLDQYPNLKSVYFIFFPGFKFSTFDAKSIPQVRDIDISTNDDEKMQFTDFSFIKQFVNKFPNITNLSIASRHAELFKVDFIPLSKLTTLYANAGGGSLLNINDAPADLPILKNAPNLENLEVIGVLSDFPSNAYHLLKLKSLKLQLDYAINKYNLNISPQISNLKKLETFDVGVFVGGGTKTKTVLSASIPVQINQLTNLKTLSILLVNFVDHKSGVIPFSYPDGIENLTKLEKLDLQTVKLMPKGIEKLSIRDKKVVLP